jgi:hypothetical protein
LINSHLLNCYYRFVLNPEKGEALAQVKRGHIAKFPIHSINFSKIFEKRLHDELVALVDIMLDLNKKIQAAKGNERERIQRQIEKTDREIDDMVYKLHGITNKESKIIEGEI